MSVIIFSEAQDQTCVETIKWLKNKKVDWVRYNEHDTIRATISLDTKGVNIKLQSGNNVSNLDSIKSFWFRKGTINIDLPLKGFNESQLRKETILHLFTEQSDVVNFIYDAIKTKPHINLPPFYRLNKLQQLNAALECDIMVPASVVVDNRSDLLNFYQANSEGIITKAISDSTIFEEDGRCYTFYTEEVTNEVIDNLPDYFFPSFFQQKLKKKADLRTFYINGQFFSMAILSQTIKQTATDFRKYSTDKPNRTIPFKLPADLEEKLDNLCRKLNVNCGSIDIVWTEDDKFYFLEVNPVGQIGMTSKPCNYNLEQIIANQLAQNEH